MLVLVGVSRAMKETWRWAVSLCYPGSTDFCSCAVEKPPSRSILWCEYEYRESQNECFSALHGCCKSALPTLLVARLTCCCSQKSECQQEECSGLLASLSSPRACSCTRVRAPGQSADATLGDVIAHCPLSDGADTCATDRCSVSVLAATLTNVSGADRTRHFSRSCALA